MIYIIKQIKDEISAIEYQDKLEYLKKMAKKSGDMIVIFGSGSKKKLSMTIKS